MEFLPVSCRRRLAAGALALAASGCTQMTQPFDTFIPLVTQFGVYKLDINQGNYISQDMVDKLKAGQTKAQVRTTLGTPLITSAFRDNRWDYVYEFQRGGRVREHRQFTVYFKDDALARWEGDEMPQSAQELNRMAATRSLPEDPTARTRASSARSSTSSRKWSTPRQRPRRSDGPDQGRHCRRRRAHGPGAHRVAAGAIRHQAGGGARRARRAVDRARRRRGRRDGRRRGGLLGRRPRSISPGPRARSRTSAACARHGVAAVVGTTGLDAAQKQALHDFGAHDPDRVRGQHERRRERAVSLVEDAARALGPGFDIEIVEMHHKHKIDAPSGTALRLGEAAAAGVGRALGESAGLRAPRHDRRAQAGAIGFATLRGGDVSASTR